MKTGIFLAGLGIFIYCFTASAMDIYYFLATEPALINFN